MTWDPRRLNRAILAFLITCGLLALLLLKALGYPVEGETIAVVAGFEGTILGFYFKADKDE